MNQVSIQLKGTPRRNIDIFSHKAASFLFEPLV